MSKILIISDVHANIQALEAVLQAIHPSRSTRKGLGSRGLVARLGWGLKLVATEPTFFTRETKG